MSKQRELLIVTGLFLAAMLLAFAFWSALPGEYGENQSTDYDHSYEPVARAIAAGQGITINGELATRYPPGFSILLAGVFRLSDVVGMADEAMLTAFRLLCVGLAVVLIYALARLVWSPRLALLPALAWMTYPFFLWLTKQPNSEVAFIPVLYASFFVFWRAILRGGADWRVWVLYLAAGVLAGAAMLIRPAALGLSLAMALAVLLCATRTTPVLARLGYGALIVFGSALAVLPWEATVYARTGQIIPLSNGGAATLHDGLTFLAVPKEYRREIAIPEDVAELMWSIHERRQETGTTSGALSVMTEEARRAPVAFIKLMLIKLARSWYGIDSRVLEMPTLLLQALYLSFSVWGSVYAWQQGGMLRRMTAGNWLIALYFWAMTFLVIPLLRYMVPVMGLLMLALPGVYLSLAAWWRGRTAPRPRQVSSNY